MTDQLFRFRNLQVIFFSWFSVGGNFAPRAMMAEVEGLLRDNADKVHAEVTEGMVRELVAREAWDKNGLRYVVSDIPQPFISCL